MAVTPMVAGAVIAGRFEIERAASSGGMGTVYRARDLRTGQTVALKLLHPQSASGQDATRLMIESQLLAELRHPRIVSYIAHGRTPTGHPFLAMEWLDGEDLSKRLLRQPLTLRESILLIRSAAEGLAAAHTRGIVHRDIKPSNLFLLSGDPERVMLLDFGVARQQQRAMSLTRTGAMVGTPGYMAPEQARGQRDLGPSADIFSLGCVFLECLTGQPPFVAPHFAALLTKILFDEAPSVVSLRPEVPPGVSDLVARMLRKDPLQRPRDGAALLSELDAVAPPLQDWTSAAPNPGPAAAPFGTEQSLMSILLASQPGPSEERGKTASGSNLEPSAGQPLQVLISDALAALGASVEWLPDQTLLVSVTASSAAPRGTALECAAQAARCAIHVRKLWPEALIVVATGRGVITGSILGGEVIERVRQFLDVHLAADLGTDEARPDILLDELTALLIGAPYVARLSPGLYRLAPERRTGNEQKPLLTALAPFVGRGHEMDMLVTARHECESESLATAVVITAPAGLGKTRLRQEFVSTLQADLEPLTLIHARALPGRQGPGSSLLGWALRSLCGIHETDARSAAQSKLDRRLGGRLAGPEHDLARAALRWLCGCSEAVDHELLALDGASDDEPSQPLVLGFVSWLGAECDTTTVLISLDDLQWADALSVNLVEQALRTLSDRPLMVLALARPEVTERFPQLWSECRCTELSLPGLSRAACERLVHEVLGPELPPATVERMLARAGGSPLYLESLIRAAAEGKTEAVPETLLAMIQADLLSHPPLARRLLRAASVFGLTFCADGVLHLLGNTPPLAAADVERCFKLLVESQVLTFLRDGARAPGGAYAFRQRLVQEALYELLSPSERLSGHREALAFLRAAGETDPSVLAEHARLAGEAAPR